MKALTLVKTWGHLGSLQSSSWVKAVIPWGMLLQMSGPPESPYEISNVKIQISCFSWIKETVLSMFEALWMCFVVYNSTCTWFRFTWHTPPAFLVNLVQIMLSSSKYCCHICLHSKLNCSFSVFSFSTSEAGLSCPVLPHPATVHLMLAGIFPFFLGSPIVFTNLFSVAFFSNCIREQRKTGNHSSLLLLLF